MPRKILILGAVGHGIMAQLHSNLHSTMKTKEAVTTIEEAVPASQLPLCVPTAYKHVPEQKKKGHEPPYKFHR